MTLKMTTAQVVETSVTVTNSSFQNYTHPDDHTTQTTNRFFTRVRLILALTICMENPVIPVRIQMERLIPMEFFRKKGNTFRGITFFSLFPEFPEISVPFVHNTSARLLTAIFPRRQNSRWRVRLKVMNL